MSPPPSIGQEVTKALEAASLLGSNPETLSAALALARQRDAEVVSSLQALAKGGVVLGLGEGGQDLVLREAQEQGEEEGLSMGPSPAPGGMFDRPAFQKAVERGLALGLKGDVAAAKHVVERRKAALVLQLQRRGPQAGSEEVRGEQLDAAAWEVPLHVCAPPRHVPLLRRGLMNHEEH